MPLIDPLGQVQCDVPEAMPNAREQVLIVSYRQRAVDVDLSFKLLEYRLDVEVYSFQSCDRDAASSGAWGWSLKGCFTSGTRGHWGRPRSTCTASQTSDARSRLPRGLYASVIHGAGSSRRSRCVASTLPYIEGRELADMRSCIRPRGSRHAYRAITALSRTPRSTPHGRRTDGPSTLLRYETCSTVLVWPLASASRPSANLCPSSRRTHRARAARFSGM